LFSVAEQLREQYFGLPVSVPQHRQGFMGARYDERRTEPPAGLDPAAFKLQV
jgi:hypothetical protein